MTEDQTREGRTAGTADGEGRTIGDLVAVISEKLGLIFRSEIAFFKTQVTEKVQGAAKGIILLVVGGILGLYALGVLIAAAILGLAEAFPAWLAALIIGGGLLLIVALLLLVGLRFLKQGQLPSGDEIKEHVKEDVGAVKKGFRS